MPVATEDNHVILEDDARMAVPGRRSLALDVADLRITCATQHWRAVLVAKRVAHSLPLTHLLIVSVEVAGIMILDQERALHVIRRRRVQSDLTFVLQALCLLQQGQSVHGTHATLICALPLFVAALCSLIHLVHFLGR